MISTRVHRLRPVHPLGLIITPTTTIMGDTMLHTVRLTVDNVTDELHPGDRFADDPAFGTVRHVRPTHDGYGNAMIYNTDGWSDVLGLPQTVTLVR